MTGSLRTRLVGAVVALLAVLLGATATWVSLQAERTLADAQRSQFEALTHQLADNIGYATLARSATSMEPSLTAFARSSDWSAVRVEDERGQLIAERRAPGGVSGPTLEVAADVFTRGAAPGDEEGELAAAPQRVGRVVAAFSTQAPERLQRRLRLQILAVFGGVGGLGLLGILLLASSVVRRVRRLAAAAGQVSKGNLTGRLAETGTDELAQLSRDFDAMTTSLAAQRAALDQAARELGEREALAGIGRATAVIAHELKNPLGILLGAAEVAGSAKQPPEARAKAGQILEQEVRRLAQTLEQLLDYARPHAPSKERLNALELARGAAARSEASGGAPLEVAVAGDGVWVSADKLQLEQVLFNLLLNAGQAGARRVAVRVRRADGRVRVEVQDDGPGVAAEIRAQLFRPFVTTKQRGAGLGLAGARRMARENGGDLVLEPSDSGARFVLLLAEG